MTSEHKRWDKRITSHIDGLHGEVTADIPFAISNFTRPLRRTSVEFALCEKVWAIASTIDFSPKWQQ